jgi:hypothetical protein
MTIATTDRQAGPYAGDGTATVFPFSFKVFNASDIGVVTIDALGNNVTLVSGYSVFLNNDQNNNPGGNVLLTTALATGSKLLIVSNVPLTQPMALANTGGFFPTVLNDSADRIVAMIQQMANKLARTITAPPSSAETSVSLLLPDISQRGSKVLGFGPDGALAAYDQADFSGVQGPAGPQGIQGPPGATGAAGTGLTNKGAWVTGTTYTASDYVAASDGAGGQALFIAKGNPGQQFVSNTQPSSDATNWIKINAPQGPAGPAGSDASVTSANIQGALGFLPVSPTQLAAKADSADLAKANRALVSTFDAAPALILPAGTAILDITGKSVPGDFGDGAYRAVATQPTHQGKLLVGGQWFELMGEFVTPDQFLRTGDTDDRAAFQRMSDYMVAKGIITAQCAPRYYDCSSGQVSFNGIAAQLLGQGFTESGQVNGWNANISGFGETARGTWIRAGLVGSRAFTFSGGNARGARVDRIGFVQSHPTPGAGWAPTNYDYLFETVGSLGGLEIGDVMLLNINKGIICDNSGRLHLQRLRGQIFTEGLYIDRAYDLTTINMMDLWSFGTQDVNVQAYQMANLKAIRILRCDGIQADKFFVIVANKGISIETGSFGSATDIQFNNAYCDMTKIGLYIDQAGSTTHFKSFTAHGENINTPGTKQAGSCSVQLTAAASGGLHQFGYFRSEYYAVNGIKNQSNSTVTIYGQPRFQVMGGNAFSSSGGVPINTAFDPISDVSSGLGTYGIDYLPATDTKEYTYAATTNSSGAVNIAHGLSLPNGGSIRGCNAWVKGNSGEDIPMSITAVDGSFIYLTSSATYATRAVRATLRLSRFTDNW